MPEIATYRHLRMPYEDDYIDDNHMLEADADHRRRIRECNERQVHPFCRGG
ncbi:hypothetical protein [Nocardia rhamnosiphila]|uniref:Uncharacterized protein n=1 Tax=Nocardia rhamnosiphila TaxID=426716 RepID=A0ABV2WZ38_9NOCA